MVNQRHNTGLESKGEYLHMAQVLAIQNRIPTTHCSDVPLVKAKDVDYYPGSEDIRMMSEWAEYTIAKALTDNFPAFKNCSKFIRPPPIKYPKKMAQKSKSCFLAMKTEDPASNTGIISLYKVNSYISLISR